MTIWNDWGSTRQAPALSIDSTMQRRRGRFEAVTVDGVNKVMRTIDSKSERIVTARKPQLLPYWQGCTIFFTGLSGAGKTTTANSLAAILLETAGRPVTVLDGDVIRTHLSSELGFSKEHRDLNIRRIGFVAEITRHGGLAICAAVAPYDEVRQEVRRIIAPLGGFVLVYVATPLEVCEARDPKGLYAKARTGLISEFTGISDPYEPPPAPDVVIDTTNTTPEEAAQQILAHMQRAGFVETCHA